MKFRKTIALLLCSGFLSFIPFEIIRHFLELCVIGELTTSDFHSLLDGILYFSFALVYAYDIFLYKRQCNIFIKKCAMSEKLRKESELSEPFPFHCDGIWTFKYCWVAVDVANSTHCEAQMLLFLSNLYIRLPFLKFVHAAVSIQCVTAVFVSIWNFICFANVISKHLLGSPINALMSSLVFSSTVFSSR